MRTVAVILRSPLKVTILPDVVVSTEPAGLVVGIDRQAATQVSAEFAQALVTAIRTAASLGRRGVFRVEVLP